MNKKNERSQNLTTVIEMLRRHGGVSQAMLKDYCGLQASTISYLVKDLKERHLITFSDKLCGEKKVGKPGCPVILDNSFASFLGLYVEDNFLESYVIGLDATDIEYRRIPLDDMDIKPVVIHTVKEVVETYPQIRGVGIAVKGIVYNDGSIRSGARRLASGQIGSWILADFANQLQEMYSDKVVVIENDANCTALYCWYAGTHEDNLITYVFNKTPFGIGSGLILNGGIYRGFSGSAGEFFEKDSDLRTLAEQVQDEEALLEQFIPALVPHVLQSAYLLDPEKIYLSGSYFAGICDETVQEIVKKFSSVPCPVQVISEPVFSYPAKGAALLATNRYIQHVVKDMEKR